MSEGFDHVCEGEFPWGRRLLLFGLPLSFKHLTCLTIHICTYSAALESKQKQILDLHSQLMALKGQGGGWSDLERLRQIDKEREREKERKRESERIKVQQKNEAVAAAAEAQILKTLGGSRVSRHAHGAREPCPYSSKDEPQQHATQTDFNYFPADDRITFLANSSEMTDKGKRLVTMVSRAIVSLGIMPVEIHGHCKCDCGNKDLSRARAQAVADKLREEGCKNEFAIIAHADGHPEIGAQMLVRIIPRPGGAADSSLLASPSTLLPPTSLGASLLLASPSTLLPPTSLGASSAGYSYIGGSHGVPCDADQRCATQGDGGNGKERRVSGSLLYVSDSADSVHTSDHSESERRSDAAPKRKPEGEAGERNEAQKGTGRESSVASRFLNTGGVHNQARGGEGVSREEAEDSAERLSETEGERHATREMAHNLQAIDSQVLQHMASIKHEACLARVQVRIFQ